MTNPFETYKKLKTEVIPLIDMELETIKNDSWGEEDESKAAILTIVKNSDKLLTDPILFSQVALGLFGIAPDFEEYEVLTSEVIEPTLELIKKISSDNKLSFTQMTDDLLGYLAVCLIEEGIYFVENNIKILQSKIKEVSKLVYAVDIPEKDLTNCEKLWEKYKDSKIDDIPNNTADEQQILINKINKEYLNFLTTGN